MDANFVRVPEERESLGSWVLSSGDRESPFMAIKISHSEPTELRNWPMIHIASRAKNVCWSNFKQDGFSEVMKPFHTTAVVQWGSHAVSLDWDLICSLYYERKACWTLVLIHSAVVYTMALQHALALRSGGIWRIRWTGRWITNKDRDKSRAQSPSIVLSSPTAPPASSPGSEGTVHHDPRRTNTMDRRQDQIPQLFPCNGSVETSHSLWEKILLYVQTLANL